MGLAGVNRLWLSEPELHMLVCMYKDPSDPGRVCYTTFQDDIDQGTNDRAKSANLKLYMTILWPKVTYNYN